MKSKSISKPNGRGGEQKHQPTHTGLISLFLLCAGAFFALPLSAQLTATDSGTASFTYPLRLPAGPAGLEPKIALAYSSAGGPSSLGHGWTVGGLSIIHRCAANYGTDGIRVSSVSYTDVDKLCLDGQRLIPTNSSAIPTNESNEASSTNKEFRTELDSYARIRSYGSGGADGPVFFKVWTKSGLIQTYGNTSSSTLRAQGKSSIATWGLSSLSDTLGNTVSFTYRYDTVNVNGRPATAWMIDKIFYDGKEVAFTYGARDDVYSTFHAGSHTASTVRLNRVTIKVGSEAIRSYEISYDYGPTTGRSRVSSIKECDPVSGKCLPPTTFTYSSGTGGEYSAKSLPFSSIKSVQLVGDTTSFLRGDFNGDGRTEILRVVNNPTAATGADLSSENQLWSFDSSANFTRATTFNLKTVRFVDTAQQPCIVTLPIDVNGDQLVDLVRISGMRFGSASWTPCPGMTPAVQVFRSRGDDIFIDAGTSGLPLLAKINSSSTSQGYNFAFGDFTGDGIADVLITWSGGAGNRPLASFSTGCPETTCLYIGSSNGTFSKIATSLANTVAYVQGPEFDVKSSAGRDIADVNGDGVMDVVSSNNVYVATGAGNFATFGAFGCGAYTQLLDINGDGKWDCGALDTGGSGDKTIKVSDGITFVSSHSYTIAGATDWTLPGSNTVGNADVARRNAYYIPVDVDGDGRTDLLLMRKSGGNTFYRSMGDGRFRISPFSLAGSGLISDTRSVVLGDFTGSDTPEILVVDSNPSNNVLYAKAKLPPPDMLTQIAAAGLLSTIEYKPFADPSLYKRDTFANSAQYPKMDTTPAGWGVASIKPSQENTATFYRYHGHKIDVERRTSLGFRAIFSRQPGGADLTATAVQRYRKFMQGNPFTGMVELEYQYALVKPSGSAETSFDWVDTFETSTAPFFSRTFNTYVDISTSAGECLSSQPNRKIYRPHLRTSVDGTKSLDGVSLSTVTTTQTYNCHGDLLTVTTQTTGAVDGTMREYQKSVVNTYAANDTSGDRWFTGRLTRSVVQSTAPDFILATSAGTAPNAAATTAQPLQVSVPPSVTATRGMPGTLTAPITASASGVFPPFTYAWQRIGGSRISVTGAGPSVQLSEQMAWGETINSTFRVTVTDAVGATRAQDFTVQFSTPVQPAISLSVPPLVQVAPAAAGPVSVPVSVSSTGGTAPYTYQWTRLSGNSITFNASGQSNTFTANVGWSQHTYTESFRVTQTDANGAQASTDLSIQVVSPSNLAVVATTPPISFPDVEAPYYVSEPLGVNVTGGTGPYTHQWQIIGYVNPNIYVDLSPGGQLEIELMHGMEVDFIVRYTVTDGTGAQRSADIRVQGNALYATR